MQRQARALAIGRFPAGSPESLATCGYWPRPVDDNAALDGGGGGEDVHFAHAASKALAGIVDRFALCIGRSKRWLDAGSFGRDPCALEFLRWPNFDDFQLLATTRGATACVRSWSLTFWICAACALKAAPRGCDHSHRTYRRASLVLFLGFERPKSNHPVNQKGDSYDCAESVSISIAVIPVPEDRVVFRCKGNKTSPSANHANDYDKPSFRFFLAEHQVINSGFWMMFENKLCSGDRTQPVCGVKIRSSVSAICSSTPLIAAKISGGWSVTDECGRRGSTQ